MKKFRISIKRALVFLPLIVMVNVFIILWAIFGDGSKPVQGGDHILSKMIDWAAA